MLHKFWLNCVYIPKKLNAGLILANYTKRWSRCCAVTQL